mmetsp:Transcript_1601/g.5520  ORF Transcript_1601/g.5520 Transcript_1601/m.5520 type:complete len:225 (-) Transcript_1601:850-1524(-)
MKRLNDGLATQPCHTSVHLFSSLASSAASAAASSTSFQSMRRVISLPYRFWLFWHPSTTTVVKDGPVTAAPVRWFSCALMSTLYLFLGLSRRSTRYTETKVPFSLSEKSFLSFFSRRSAGVSLLASFMSAWACSRSSICARTSFSTAVGSAVASEPSTRIRLLSFTFGFGASTRPCRCISCCSCTRAARACLRILRVSFFVIFRGCGGGGSHSAGGSMGTGCST